MRFPPRSTRLDRPVFRELLGALAAAISGLTMLVSLSGSPRFGERVVNRGRSSRVIARPTGPPIPGFVSIVLCGITYVASRLINQRPARGLPVGAAAE